MCVFSNFVIVYSWLFYLVFRYDFVLRLIQYWSGFSSGPRAFQRCFNFYPWSQSKLQNKFEKIGYRDPKKLEDGNPANIYRAARRCGIQCPQTIGLKELYLRYKDCREHAKKMMADSLWMWRSTQLRDAINKNDKESETAIKQQIRSEVEKKEWNGTRAAT